MKKLIVLLTGLLAIPVIAFAINVTVPMAPGANYVLLSTTTGMYNAVATSSLGISGGGTPAGTTTNIQYNNNGAFGATSSLTYNSSTGVEYIKGALGINALSPGAFQLYVIGGSYFNGNVSLAGLTNGSFLAVDPNGTIISTTSPTGGTATTTINGASGPNFTFSTTSSGTLFTISTSTGTVLFTFPANLLSTTTAAVTYPSFTYASSTFPTYTYATNTYITYPYATSTFAQIANVPTYTYASSTYYFASNPSGYITSSALTPYVTLVYASSTFPSFTYSSSTYLTASSLSGYVTNVYATATFPSFTYASATYLTSSSLNGYVTNTYATATFPSFTYASSTFPTYAYASSTFASTSFVTANYIPYTGGTANVNLGAHTFTVSSTSTLASTTITALQIATTTNQSYPLVVGIGGGSGSATFWGGVVPRSIGYASAASTTIVATTTDIATTTVNQTSTFAISTPTIINQMLAIYAYATTSQNVFFSGIATGSIAFPTTIASGTTQWLFGYDSFRAKWVFMASNGTY